MIALFRTKRLDFELDEELQTHRSLLEEDLGQGMAPHEAGYAALGVGANSAIYSLADVLLLRPLQIPDLDPVATLREQ